MKKASLFTFARNAVSLGYPIVEAVHNLLPLAAEVVIVDCGSTDGTKELLQDLAVNPHVKLHHDVWTDGAGGRNYNKSSDLCHSLCANDVILFAEADEVWEESLVAETKQLLAHYDHLKFHRMQLTQNFQRCPWYFEEQQILPRIFPKGSCNIVEGNTTAVATASTVSLSSGYIVDCRNVFRDNYLLREREGQKIWNDQRTTVRMVPAHSNYSWEMTQEQAERELTDARWTWTTTPFRLPKILDWHVGRTKYEIRPELIEIIKGWTP